MRGGWADRKVDPSLPPSQKTRGQSWFHQGLKVLVLQDSIPEHSSITDRIPEHSSITESISAAFQELQKDLTELQKIFLHL